MSIFPQMRDRSECEEHMNKICVEICFFSVLLNDFPEWIFCDENKEAPTAKQELCEIE